MAQLRKISTVGGEQIATVKDIQKLQDLAQENIGSIKEHIKNISIDGGNFDNLDNENFDNWD